LCGSGILGLFAATVSKILGAEQKKGMAMGTTNGKYLMKATMIS